MAKKPMIASIAPAMGTVPPKGRRFILRRKPKTMQDRIQSSNGGGI